MKRSSLIKYLTQNGCFLIREGSNHSLYKNPKNGKITTIARHPEISELMCKVICKQLDIPRIG